MQPIKAMQSRLFFVFLIVAIMYVTGKVLAPYLILMITGVLVAVIARPIDRSWEKVLPNRMAAFATMFTVLIILVVPLFFLGFALVEDAQSAADAIADGRLEEAVNETLVIVAPFQSDEERNQTLETVYGQIETRVEEQVDNFLAYSVQWIVDFTVGITVVLFVVYYVLTDGDRLLRWLRNVAPLPPAQVDHLMREGHNGIRAVFFGQILTSLIQAGVGGFGLLVAGVPNVFVWTALMAILSLLPVVGAFLIWVPASIWLLARGDMWQGIFLASWGAIVVGNIDNFVRPRLIGGRAGIHPLFVLVGVLGGIAAYGFIGLFLGPLLVGLTVTILRVWETDYLEPSLRADAEEE